MDTSGSVPYAAASHPLRIRRRDALKLTGVGAASVAASSPLFARRIGGDAQATRQWWKDAVIYQVYARSFQDSNADGIGDLRGITSRLGYLQDLGVDVVWLSWHYPSLSVAGYDVSDFRSVSPVLGTMADFEVMLDTMSRCGMRLLVNLVTNHTSDRHPWFLESRSARDNPYRDFYFWRDGRNGGPPSNWPAITGGSAWEKDERTGQYYLHLFTKQQPDLNWDNPHVRAEIYDIMRFWLDKGVAGFRMDIIPLISKDPTFPDLTEEQLRTRATVYANGPRRDEFIREMHEQILDPYGVMSVGEVFGLTPEQSLLLSDSRRPALDMVVTFDVTQMHRLGRPDDWTLPQLKRIIARLDRVAGEHSWNTFYLESHDQARSVSRLGDPDPLWRDASAKTLGTLLMTQRATPFIFQGQEIGMTNFPWESIEQINDAHDQNWWEREVGGGRRSAADMLKILGWASRDNARTPMQWTAGRNGGFTEGTPWLPVNPNAGIVNVENQRADSDSVLAHFQRLIELRKRLPALVHGAYRDVDPDHPTVLAYTRGAVAERYLVLLNFSREPIDYRLPASVRAGALLLECGGVAASAETVRLNGWSGAIFTAAE